MLLDNKNMQMEKGLFVCKGAWLTWIDSSRSKESRKKRILLLTVQELWPKL